ncbi:OLC1v1003879C1 [Oldenlandia corymbosa var. corymbosa]|uniref:OLC1v1003879C1 n=1 Tax=Oldenlandia corymbosa var. corymbosa TaxID=529605 RepID=A0AAV1DDQ2_OLDCO|nr:OLC1v1003879C1 [Oldenlandia corymbosa var. corymbosa]
MGSKWRKAKMALQMKMCLTVPRSSEESSPGQSSSTRFSDAGVSLSPATPRRHSGGGRLDMPTTPVPSSSGLRLPKHSSKSSSKKTCAICLNTMKPGHGHAIFTAECSHSFHFHCITSNVKHGNQMCPICRAKWKEIPFQSPANDITRGRARNSNGSWPQDDPWVTVLRRLPAPRLETPRHTSSSFLVAEPSVFNDDDELISCEPERRENSSDLGHGHIAGKLDLKAYPEVSAVSKSASHNDFTILIHLKAPNTGRHGHFMTDQSGSLVTSHQSRVPVDLVTVLDVSGSMAGTKLALLKRAMGFVIQNLGPSDRLSVIAFSSTARRLFSLRRMTDVGKEEALQAVNSLSSSGGTNIAEGLKKGAKVMTDRKSRNPVSSIILLSDGQDTYSISPGSTNRQSDYQSLLPVSMHRGNNANIHIPVHSFGFGADHDSISMHSISENSGGTFSFIEAESVIQDAFAQCIGGLLSVVVQELTVNIECLHPGLQLKSIKAGSYKTKLMSDSRMGSIEVGDLYAEEERDFLITLDIPVERSSNEMPILNAKCAYKDPVSKEPMTLNQAIEVKILRPEVTAELVVSMEVDRQRNRLRSAEAMAEARAAAERGDLASAVSVLEECRNQLVESVSHRTGDKLSTALDAELKEMQERMASRQTYETSGRAYVLSGLSSHSWQRATARGDSTDSTSLVQAYQTPSMVDMVSRSQTMILGSPSPRRTLRPALSFPARPQPR